MLIPVEWLKDYVQVSGSVEDLADRLTLTGNEIEEIRESETGPVLDLKLTPNRADMLSIRGAGREVAALTGQEFRDPGIALHASGPEETGVYVDVEAPDLCPRYVARIIRGVKIGPSPEWLRRRLEAVGLRSISNVVDITNYVMFELGQPLHAFDLDLLDENRIVVRRARAGETITAIDGTEAKLEPQMLVIADASRPVAIAGVMGGQDTEVSDRTVNILLESAYFNPTSVRRTAKRTGVSSPSSYRFERGVDPNGVLRAADRAAQLIAELAGGTVSKTVLDVYPTPIEPREIRFRPERCRALLGVEVSDADAETFLTRLGMRVQRDSPEAWTVQAPTFRPDLAIEEDIIEEVGRLYGYDRLPETMPGGVTSPGKRSALENLVRQVREQLLAQGMYEAVTNTLVSRTQVEGLGVEVSPVWPGVETAEAVPLRNPLSEEFSMLRPSLLPGLIAGVQHNLRRGISDVYLFEAGWAHSRLAGEAPQDRLLIAGVMVGSRWSGVWNADRQSAADFYTAKGALEALARALGIGELRAERVERTGREGAVPTFHPGRCAWLYAGADRIGVVGELHPATADSLDLPRGVYLFELDGELLLRHSSGERRYESPSRFPRALRDLAVVVDQTVPSAQIEQILRESVGEWARTVRLFDVYAGKPLPEGKVSLAYALELGAEDRTLQDAEVDARLENARERLRTEVAAEFRG